MDIDEIIKELQRYRDIAREDGWDSVEVLMEGDGKVYNEVAFLEIERYERGTMIAVKIRHSTAVKSLD